MSTWAFAQQALAKPLGFSLAQWPRDPQGIYFGGNDMLLTPRQMLSIGALYLNRGKADSRQVLSEDFVRETFVAPAGQVLAPVAGKVAWNRRPGIETQAALSRSDRQRADA
jgi:hypothetical protein